MTTVGTKKAQVPEKFIFKPDLAKLVTAAELKDLPLYNWFYFPHSYSPNLVKQLIQYWKNDGRGSVSSILDPFVGAGTTLIAARSLEMDAIGTDLSPLAIQVTKAKLGRYNRDSELSQLKLVLETAKHDLKRYSSADSRISKAFSSGEYRNLRRLRESIASHGESGLLFLAFLNVLKEVSRAYADGGWFRWVEKPNVSKSIFSRFEKTALRFIDEIPQTPETGGKQSTYLSDARELLGMEEQFDAVITSPPYPNRHDYTRVFHLELLLGSKLKNEDILNLRHRSLRSHVEAKRPKQEFTYKEPNSATIVIDNIVSAGADVRVERMLRGYLEDMYISLLRMHERLAPHGRVALVVSNVRHSGVMFPADELLAEVAAQAGFHWESTWVARYRGNSSQQMLNHGRDPARESIVLLQKV